MMKNYWWLILLMVALAGGTYVWGYSRGADMASDKWEAGMDVVRENYEEALQVCRATTDDVIATTKRSIENTEKLLRLSSDLTFDLAQCRGGGSNIEEACLWDENCADCLGNNFDIKFCVQSALHDKNSWYQVMGLDYVDGD